MGSAASAPRGQETEMSATIPEVSEKTGEVISLAFSELLKVVGRDIGHLRLRRLHEKEVRERTNTVEPAPYNCIGSNNTLEEFQNGRRKATMKAAVYEVSETPSAANKEDMKREVSWLVYAAKDDGRKRRASIQVLEALKQRNRCDLGNYCLLGLVREVFNVVDPTAKVEWLLVWPRALTRFVDQGSDTIPECMHSVIKIELGAGKAWVLDLSAAQFGFKSNQMCDWEDYKKHRLASSKERTGPKWTEDTADHEAELEKVGQEHNVWKVRRAFHTAYHKWQDGLEGREQWWRGVDDLEWATIKAEIGRLVALTKSSLYPPLPTAQLVQKKKEWVRQQRQRFGGNEFAQKKRKWLRKQRKQFGEKRKASSRP